ncbi:MAG: orotate phosphoribosyltransferase [Eggerthellaceae bacterium]|nr:orotate phosphoribosyltransferase [Eggerthellaceae bacterium]
MNHYKQEFIEFMIESNVLKFGDFTLKSGRKSPFFINAGAYTTGEQLARLSEFYAQSIHRNFNQDFNIVFGPAYKGIPLSVITAMGLKKLYNMEVQYCSNRKENKDHGADKGILLGAELHDGDKVIIVEDVTTSGKSINNTYPILKAIADVEVIGLAISFDRMEVGPCGTMSATSEIQEKYGFPVRSIVNMDEVRSYMEQNGKLDADTLSRIDAYYEKYGVK